MQEERNCPTNKKITGSAGVGVKEKKTP